MRRWLRAGAVAIALVGWACAAGASEANAQETGKLHALFDSQWEDYARDAPVESTFRGDLRYNDRLPDLSAQARASRDARVRQWLAQARAIHRERLSHDDQVSLDLFEYDMAMMVQEQSFPGYRSLLVGSEGGPQSELANILREVPMATAAQADQLLKRLAAYPAFMDQQIALLREGMAIGWVSSRDVLDRALGQLDDQLAPPVDGSAWFEAFKRLGADIPAAERERLQAAGRESIARNVVPSLRKLRAFIVDEYRPRAPADGAMRSYPGGDRVYEYLVRSRITTPLTAQQVHAIGVRELAALRGEMDQVQRQVKFDGTFAQFIAYLNTDLKFFFKGPEELLAGYRDITKRIDPELPRLFAELPRVPYGVRAMPAFRGPDAAEYYSQGAQDGSRAGYFNANAVGWKSRPTWRMATLAAHESVPGHHLQIARAMELRGLPQFRRNGYYTAYVEGWAVYAEALGREIGLYDDPYSLFGHLQWRAFRAARLVVDTGIHSLGWSRQQAIDFMVERTGMDRGFVTSEVDRYVSDPGQALGYMIGALKIAQLRERAKAKLGDRFDLRRFHNTVIDNGPLPLDVLDKLVDEWIEQEKSR